MYRTLRVALVLLLSALLIATDRRTSADDQAAVPSGKKSEAEQKEFVAKIKALDGTIERDLQQPGSPIIGIDLSDSQALKDQDLKVLSSLTSLQQLNLSGTGTSDAGLKHLSRLTNLTHLYLIGTKITDAGLKELTGLQKLEELRFGNTGITDAGLKDVAKLKNLKMVGLLNTATTDAGLKEFSAALPNMRHNGGPDDGGGNGLFDTVVGVVGALVGNQGGAAQGGGQRTDPNFDVSVAQPAYTKTHPSVLFDEAHQNFHTASGRYKVFAELITNDGYRLTPNKDPLTAERLAGYKVLVSANATASEAANKSAFTAAECDTIERWVKEGGSLLLITDHEPFASGSNELGKRFGIDMSLDVATDPVNDSDRGLLFAREKNQIGDHSIMTGRDKSEQVNRVLTFTGQSLKGPAGSVALLKFANTALHQSRTGKGSSAAGRSQGLALKHGKGRVVVMGEAAQLSAQVFGTPPIPMGMNVPNCDNRKMALNVMHWLSELTD